MGVRRRAVDKYRREGFIPLLGSVVRAVVRQCRRRFAWFTYRRYRYLRSDTSDDVLWVDPGSIRFAFAEDLQRQPEGRHFETAARPEYYRYAEFGDVIGGDWDEERIPVTEYTEWHLVIALFFDDRCLEETDIYEACIDRLDRGAEVWGAETTEEFRDRIAYLEELKTSIEMDGYRRNKKPDDRIGAESLGPAHRDEITVSIARDGTLLYVANGRHRLALAHHCGVSEVPVLVHVRHAKWQAVREAFTEADSLEEVPDEYRKYNNHPDVSELL